MDHATDHVNLSERTERRRLLRDFEKAEEGRSIKGYEAYAQSLKALNANWKP